MLRLLAVLVLAGGLTTGPAGAGSVAAAAPVAPVVDVAAAPTSVRAATGRTAPVDGPLRVTRPFQPPPGRYAAGHRGVDLASVPGAPVRSAADGVVVFAGAVAGRPVVSVALGDGLRTTYEPVAPSVAAGQRVSRGTVLGVLEAGHPGCPVAACLHWGLLRDETYLDPLALLRPPRIRLLPARGSTGGWGDT